MYITCTRHTVKDYAAWRAAFAENSPMLDQNGVGWEIVQVGGDPHDIAVICRSPSKKEWDAFLAADAAKQKRTGVDPRKSGMLVGEPQWWAGEQME